MLRAIGGRRTTIVRDLLAEAAILGVIGGAIGAGIGIALGWHGNPPIASGDNPGPGSPRRVLVAWLRDTGGPGGDCPHQHGGVGDGRAAGVQGVTDRGLGAGRSVGRRFRAALAADGLWGRQPLPCSRRRLCSSLNQHGTLAFAAVFALFTAEIVLGFALTALMVKADCGDRAGIRIGGRDSRQRRSSVPRGGSGRR